MTGQGVSEEAETVSGEDSRDDLAKLARENCWNSLLLTSSLLPVNGGVALFCYSMCSLVIERVLL